MAAVINACTTVVNLSDREGFPNSVMEAMACGVPCVATDVGATRDLLEGVGDVIAPGDVRAASTAIERIIDQPARAAELAQEARERLLETYAPPRVCEEFAGLILQPRRS